MIEVCDKSAVLEIIFSLLKGANITDNIQATDVAQAFLDVDRLPSVMVPESALEEGKV